MLHRLDDAGLIDVTRVVLDTAHVRAKRGDEQTGPSPVDRGKPGSEMHILPDANGLPLTHAPPRPTDDWTAEATARLSLVQQITGPQGVGGRRMRAGSSGL
ncbi:hypothetical protein GCM10023097_43790 [Streptomyces collinus]